MSGNLAIKGGVGRPMANAILNFHFDFLHPSLIVIKVKSHSFTFAASEVLVEDPRVNRDKKTKIQKPKGKKLHIQIFSSEFKNHFLQENFLFGI